VPPEDLAGIAPELWLLFVVLVLLVAAPFSRARPSLTTWLAVGALLAPVPAIVAKFAEPAHLIFEGTYAVDPLALVVKLIVIAGAAVTLLATRERFAGSPHATTVPALVTLTALGAMGLAASVDLVLITLALQLTTVPTYALVGLLKDDPRANEATLKYFLFAAASGAVMLYGAALLYALTGTLSTVEIARRLVGADLAVAVVAGVLFLTGFAFKITAVPLHWWAPDAYEGATAPVAGFLSIVPKAGGLAILARVLTVAFPDPAAWAPAVSAAAVATMTLGNVLALRQDSLKRLLAYSSIAQAGFLLVAVAAVGSAPLAVPALVLYLLAYLAMNLAAFVVVGIVERAAGTDQLAAFAGLGERAPFLAAAFTLLLFSLAGVPPLLGFVAKVALFLAAIQGGYAWLAVVAAANAAFAVAYYLRVIAAMYFAPPSTQPADLRAPSSGVAVAIGVVGTVAFGVVPAPLVALAFAGSGIIGP
jgi:NADH-quinone oxidoreductase subunit N